MGKWLLVFDGYTVVFLELSNSKKIVDFAYRVKKRLEIDLGHRLGKYWISRQIANGKLYAVEVKTDILIEENKP